MIQKEYKGFLLSWAIGLAAYFLSHYTPHWLNGILLALMLGMLIGNFVKIPQDFQSGISFTSSKLLELSILFIAFGINYAHVAALGTLSFTAIAIIVLLMLIITFYLANKVNCPGSTGWLVGFGTAICGSSAIAALAPSVSKKSDDVAIAMAVVNLFGSIGMLVLPFILSGLNLNTQELGLLIGGGLHSVGNVAGAGYSMSKEIGDTAITVKLARVALLSPALIFFNYLVNKNEMSGWKSYFKLPWYLWGFIIISIISSYITLPAAFLSFIDFLGKIVLIIAMAAIGLKVSFKQMFQSGQKGLSFGLLIFVIQLTLLSLVVLIM
ncbi:MAG: putative sulfate exporter family transporter [Bacteroidia bacterium]|nr:putative sulfate exporter family transporter [Bacteroidia bacterium]